MDAPKQRRKRVLDLERQSEVCAMITVGGSMRAAARVAGCSATAIAKAAKADPEFGRKLKRAALHRELSLLRNVEVAGRKSWRASAWLLQRLNPDEYVARKPNTVTPEILQEQVLHVIDHLLNAVPREARARIHQEMDDLVHQLDEEQKAERDFDRAGGSKRSAKPQRRRNSVAGPHEPPQPVWPIDGEKA